MYTKDEALDIIRTVFEDAGLQPRGREYADSVRTILRERKHPKRFAAAMEDEIRLHCELRGLLDCDE